MEVLLAFPVLILAFILQTTIVSRITLISGTADLMMLILCAWALQEKSRNAWMWAILGGLAISFGSAIPFFVYPLIYLVIVGIAQIFRSRIWQSPFLAMAIITIAGTFLLLGAEFVILRIMGINLGFNESLTRTILPSMLLNLLLAFPVFLAIREISRLIYQTKNEA